MLIHGLFLVYGIFMGFCFWKILVYSTYTHMCAHTNKPTDKLILPYTVVNASVAFMEFSYLQMDFFFSRSLSREIHKAHVCKQ